MSKVSVVELVGMPLITKWVDVDFVRDLESLNAVRKSIAALTHGALSIVENQFNCNGHIGLNALSKEPSPEDKITKALHANVWNQFFKGAVIPNVSTGTAAFIDSYVLRNRSFFGNSFEKFGLFTVENIENALLQLNHLEGISILAAPMLKQLDDLCGGALQDVSKFKMNQGTFEQKAQAIAELAYVSSEFYNIIAPFYHKKIESHPIEQYLKLLKQLNDNAVRVELGVGEMITVKLFANGNIDVQVKNDSVGFYLHQILSKPCVVAA